MYLGNLAIEEFLKRAGIQDIITEEDKRLLNQYRNEKADIPYNESALHIFDIPFSIHVSEPIYDTILKMLTKYNSMRAFNEPLQVVKIVETEKHKKIRLKKEAEKSAREEAKNDPNKIWHVRYFCLVPVVSNNKQYLYDCFVNVYVKGFYNIPEEIDGTLTIWKDEEGFNGYFSMNDSEFIKADEYHFVIGNGFCDINGNWLYRDEETMFFEKTSLQIKEGIKNHKNILNNNVKTVYWS
jgi:hypothetical protein